MSLQTTAEATTATKMKKKNLRYKKSFMTHEVGRVSIQFTMCGVHIFYVIRVFCSVVCIRDEFDVVTMLMLFDMTHCSFYVQTQMK